MALLKKHTNRELQALYQEALLRGTPSHELAADFGLPPYHFIGPRTGPVARYNDFHADYVDREGREYSQLDDEAGNLGVRIPRAARKRDPTLQFPQPGETVQALSLDSYQVLVFQVVSLQINKTRSATGWIEISI